MKELIIDAAGKNLDVVLDFVNEELEKACCPSNLCTKIGIAAEEIFINIAQYAYTSKTGSVIIKITCDKEAIIEFEDTGIPYNPLENADPDLTASAVDRDVGGLGIYMVKQIMDSAEYRHKDGKNILVIRKMITGG